jgi:hypothetical protein
MLGLLLGTIVIVLCAQLAWGGIKKGHADELAAVSGFEASTAWLTGMMFIAAILMVIVQISVTVFHTVAPLALLILGASVFLTILIAGVFGYLSMRLIQTIRRTRQHQFETNQKIQHVENDRLRAIYDLTSTLTATLNHTRHIEGHFVNVIDGLLNCCLKPRWIVSYIRFPSGPRRDRSANGECLRMSGMILPRSLCPARQEPRHVR